MDGTGCERRTARTKDNENDRRQNRWTPHPACRRQSRATQRRPTCRAFRRNQSGDACASGSCRSPYPDRPDRRRNPVRTGHRPRPSVSSERQGSGASGWIVPRSPGACSEFVSHGGQRRPPQTRSQGRRWPASKGDRRRPTAWSNPNRCPSPSRLASAPPAAIAAAVRFCRPPQRPRTDDRPEAAGHAGLSAAAAD